MLGESDYDEGMNQFPNSFFGGISGKMINKMIESTMKMLEKEMQKEMKRQEKDHEPKTNFQLFINGKKADFGGSGDKSEKETAQIELPNNELKGYQKLPRKEPKTNLRRFSDKVIYEISMPGIESDDDVSVTRLENSIEVKGVSKKNSYKKVIPINLPITSYDISKGKLVLEMSGE